MKKNMKLISTLMTLIGVICTGILAYRLYQKFFAVEEDLDLDCFDDDFEEEEDEEEAVEEEEVPAAAAEVEEEEEKPLPKVRRGYIPLKFHTNA